MSGPRLFIISVVLFAFLSLSFLTACGTSSSSSTGSTTPTSATIDTGQAESILQTQCTRCHSLDRVTSKQKTVAEWKVTVDRMIQHGAQLNASEEQNLVQYLAQKY